MSQIQPIEEDILDDYLSAWSAFELPKKTMITTADSMERYLYFVLEGVQKSYYLNDGKQHILFFGYPPSFCGVMESFLTQTPSRYFLETITASKFIRISYDSHQQMIQKHRPLESLFRITTERLLNGVIQRHHELLTYNAETRLKVFMDRSAHLLNLIPHKDLASYLRIDATNFSKMINRIRL